MKRLALCVIAVIAFAACNSQRGARAATNSPPLQPGYYQYDDSQNSNDVTIRHCVTREEAADPRLIFSLQDKSCRFPKYVMSDGSIDVRMVCGNSGVTRTDVITGTYTPTSLSLDIAISVAGGSESGTQGKSHLLMRRVGECPAGT